MTSPGIKGPPTVESGCGEGNRVAGDRMGGSANGVIPADLHPATRIAHIINGVNIRKNLIFIIIS
jgi:hypothetical protein